MKAEADVNTDLSQKSLKVAPSILDAFDLLKNPKDDIKLNGCAKIISLLQNNESEKNAQYALKRLVRSLGANIPDQRAGYFATLVTLLKKNLQLKIPELLELVNKELHANGSSKSEIGDVALGQILVCGAVFRSGLLLTSSEDEQKQVVKLLFDASKKKSYLGTVAYQLLLDFVDKLNAEQFSSIIWSNFKLEFKKDLKEHSLDSLYFLMMVTKKFPEKVKLRKLMGFNEILCEDNIHTICEKIMAGIDLNSVNHPIFTEIGKQIANSPHLVLFWTSGIDSQLVKHNRNRELVAINLLTSILQNIGDNAEIVPELLSKNFFKLFMDWFKGLQTASKIRNKRDDEDDHKLMIKKEKELLNTFCKTIYKSDKCSDKTKVEVLTKLLFNPGEINFSELTGTSIVKTIIVDLEKDGVKKMAKLLKGVLLNTSKKYIKENVERNWFNNERLKAAELISYLVSHESMKDDTGFKLTYMKLLMCFGFFKIGGDENLIIGNELSGAIKNSFYRCFSSKFTNADSLVEVLSSLNEFMNTTLKKETVRAKLEKQFSKENVDCWDMLTEVCKNIENKSKIDKVFLILLYQLGLFLFSEPTHVKMARSSIKELKSCYEHYKKGKKKKPIKLKEGDVTVDEPEWIEVLVEVLLSILSTESSVLRSIVQCVFRLIWENLTPSSVDQIVSILDPENESNPLTQNSDSEGDNDDSDIDEEKVNGGSDKKSESGEDSDSDPSEDDDDDDDDEDMKAPDQLRIAVQKALGATAVDSETESIDADMIDEEEGQKLDEALAEAFRQYNQGKGKKSKKERKDKKAIFDFRIRALDLIDIYLEKDPAMDICLSMIPPLTRCLEFCIHDGQFSELENRVRKTIKNLTKIRKFSTTENVNNAVLCEFLNSVIDKGNRSHFMIQALGDVITNFGTFIVSCSQKIDSKVSPIVDIYKESLHSYFQNRNCMLPIIFFHNVLQTDWVGTYELLPGLIENIFDHNVRQFRRNEGLELMAGFYRVLKRHKPSDKKLINKLSKIERQFETKIIETLHQDSNFTAKSNYFASLRKLINCIKMFHESCHIESNLNYSNLLDVVGSFKGVVKTKIEKPVGQSLDENKEPKSKKHKQLKRKLNNVNGLDVSKKVKNVI